MLNRARAAALRYLADPPPPPPDCGTACCICCVERPRSRVFEPCMHVCACDACSALLDACPICKQEILARRRVYIA